MSEAQAQGQATPEAAGRRRASKRTLTQADSGNCGQKKPEGKQAGINELLERDGCRVLGGCANGYSEYQGIQEAVTTEADRANAKAEKLEARAKAAEERYTSTLRDFALRDALRDAGINPERIKGAMRLADASALEVDADGNVSGLEDVVEAVRDEAPEFFGATERPRVNAPQTNGTGVSRPASNTDPQQSYADWLLGVLQQSN